MSAIERDTGNKTTICFEKCRGLPQWWMLAAAVRRFRTQLELVETVIRFRTDLSYPPDFNLWNFSVPGDRLLVADSDRFFGASGRTFVAMFGDVYERIALFVM